MRVLFIGGTGTISTSCTIETLDRGIEVWHFNRGNTAVLGSRGDRIQRDVTTINGDIRDTDNARTLLKNQKFDCVVDWVAYTEDHIAADLDLFSGVTDQFIFISSASVYQKPPNSYLITEATPAVNHFWKYSQDKIRCECALRLEHEKSGFPFTIVRPSHTYCDGRFPTTFGSNDFTVPKRLLDGRKIIVHGDGQSLWTITHADDFAKGFAGLIGNPAAIGETFHITGDEVLTWDQIHRIIATTLGSVPNIVHIPSEYIAKRVPAIGPGLIGDKQYSLVFDNAKIKRVVPEYHAEIPFSEGMKRSLEWAKEHGQMSISEKTDAMIDELLLGWKS